VQPTEVTEILGRIDRLWPKCDWTPEARVLFAEKIGRFDRDQVLAVVDEARATSRWSSPQMGDIVKGCREASTAKGGDYGHAAYKKPPPELDPPGLTWAVWADRELQSGKARHPDQIADLWNIAEGRPSCYGWVARAQERERTGKYPPTLAEMAGAIAGREDAERERRRQAIIQRATERDMGIE
jgi:hypothetical protein